MEKKYSIFVRNKKSNKLDIIFISDKDIYGEGEKYKKAYNNLYEIDLFTSKFRNEDELISYIYGDILKIDPKDADIFAVCIDEDKIYMESCLFKGSKEEDNDQFKRNPIYNSLLRKYRSYIENKLNDKESRRYEIDSILSDFSYVMYHNEDFYNFIMSYDNKIDRNYLEYFKGGFRKYDTKTPIKDRDDGWAKESDLLLRQIVEAFGMYEDKKRRNGIKLFNERNDLGGDVYYDHYDSFSRYYNGFNNSYDEIMMIDDTAVLMENMDPNMFTFRNNIPKIDLSSYSFCDRIDISEVNDIDDSVMKLIYSYAVYYTYYKDGDRSYNDFLVDIFDRLINNLRVNPMIAQYLSLFLLSFNKELEKSKRSDADGFQKRKGN